MGKKSYCISLDEVLMDKLRKTDDNLSGRINLLLRNYLENLKSTERVSTNEVLKDIEYGKKSQTEETED